MSVSTYPSIKADDLAALELPLPSAIEAAWLQPFLENIFAIMGINNIARRDLTPCSAGQLLALRSDYLVTAIEAAWLQPFLENIFAIMDSNRQMCMQLAKLRDAQRRLGGTGILPSLRLLSISFWRTALSLLRFSSAGTTCIGFQAGGKEAMSVMLPMPGTGFSSGA